MIDSLSIKTYSLESNQRVTVVELVGHLDSITSSQVEKALNKLIDQKKFQLVIDLAGVNYISSSGWGIFIGILKEVRLHEGDLKLSGLNDDVREVFKLLEIDFYLPLFKSTADAVASYA